MSSALLLVCGLLISFTGLTAADGHQSVSTDAVIALACVFGFIGLVILCSGICYFVRKQRYRDNRRRQEKLAIVSKLFKEQQEKESQKVEKSANQIPEGFIPIQVDEQDVSRPTDDMVVEKQRYADWRQSQSSNVIVTNGVPVTGDSRYVYRTRANTMRSISPTRFTRGSPVMERGRSRQRTLVYRNGGENYKNGTVVMTRSKSAPAVNRQPIEYVPGGIKPVYFTKSHYMAIKKPFSKKYFLPPVRTQYIERPMVKKVMYAPAPQSQPRRQIIEVQRPAPPPQQRQEVIEGNVYHVQYTPGPNQTIHTQQPNDLVSDNYQLSSSHSHHSPRIYTSDSQSQQRIYTTDSSYQSHSPTIISPQPHDISSNYVHYTNAHSNGKVIPASQWYGNNIYVNRQESNISGGDDVFMASSSNRVSYATEAHARSGADISTVDANYTIVDFVDPNEKTEGKTVLSTSTPRFPGHDASALQDLDNFLNSDKGSSSSSVAGSSSSDKSSK